MRDRLPERRTAKAEVSSPLAKNGPGRKHSKYGCRDEGQSKHRCGDEPCAWLTVQVGNCKWSNMQQRISSGARNQHRKQSTTQREQQPLRSNKAYQLCTRCAKGRTQCDFAGTPHG